MYYLTASGVSAKDGKLQTAIILNCAGPQVLEVCDNIAWESDDDKHKPDKVLEALENYCNPRDNEVLPDGMQNDSSVLQLWAQRQNDER